MTQERYFIGPGLRDKLRETITRVDGLMGGESGARVPTVVQDLQRPASGKHIQVVTITNAWDKNTQKTVTFRNQTATPNTVVATNLLFDVAGPATSGASTTKVCIVGKEGTAWYFVNTEKESCNGGYKARELDDSASDSSSAANISSGSEAQVLVNDNGCVRWVGLRKITVVGSGSPGAPITLGGEGIVYPYKTVYVLDDVSSPGEHTIEVTACSTTVTGP